MSRLGNMIEKDGLFLALQRVAVLLFRRVRNRAVAAKLGAPGFYCAHAPRLLGLRYMRVGRNLRAGDHLWLQTISAYEGARYKPELVIGDDVTFSDAVHIGCLTRIEIGAGCLFGSRVLVIDHAHGNYRGEQQSSPDVAPALRALVSNGPVSIGENVWLGDGVVVLPGASIGRGCVIGANSVVTGAIAAETMAAGAPARPIRRWDRQREEWVRFAELNGESEGTN